MVFNRRKKKKKTWMSGKNKICLKKGDIFSVFAIFYHTVVY